MSDNKFTVFDLLSVFRVLGLFVYTTGRYVVEKITKTMKFQRGNLTTMKYFLV